MRDDRGDTPLNVAAFNGQFFAADELCRRGANVNSKNNKVFEGSARVSHCACLNRRFQTNLAYCRALPVHVLIVLPGLTYISLYLISRMEAVFSCDKLLSCFVPGTKIESYEICQFSVINM